MIKRGILLAALLSAFLAVDAHAEEPSAQAAPDVTAEAEPAQKPKCKEKMAQMEAKKAEMAALDTRVAEMMQAVHDAPRRDRQDAMIALLAEMTAQRPKMRAMQSEMHQMRMAHMEEHRMAKGSMGGRCKMMSTTSTSTDPAEGQQ